MGLAMLPGLVSYTWPQAILWAQPPKALELQAWVTTPGLKTSFYLSSVNIFWKSGCQPTVSSRKKKVGKRSWWQGDRAKRRRERQGEEVVVGQGGGRAKRRRHSAKGVLGKSEESWESSKLKRAALEKAPSSWQASLGCGADTISASSPPPLQPPQSKNLYYLLSVFWLQKTIWGTERIQEK